MTRLINKKESEQNARFSECASRLAGIGRSFYARGWVLGTSGNFSAVVNRDPLRLAITSSGVDKSELGVEHILQVDSEGKVIEGTGRPSAETLLHLTVARLRGAAAVLHTHSVWSNILSDAQAASGGLVIEGYEMLKGLAGVTTHEHREWVPVIENSQDMRELAVEVELSLNSHTQTHGFLLRRHGLYTWGASLSEAKRHVEIFEFLLEVIGRTYCAAK
jgi:methylthioribulose-1-phosphate dehydratase